MLELFLSVQSICLLLQCLLKQHTKGKINKNYNHKLLLIIFPSIARANVQLSALKVMGEKKVAVIRSQWKDKNTITYDTLLSFLPYHLPTLSQHPPVFTLGDFLMRFGSLVVNAVQSPLQCVDLSSFVQFSLEHI